MISCNLMMYALFSLPRAFRLPFVTFICLRPDFTSKLVPELAFGIPKFYIAPYDKIKHELVKLSSNCDVKSGLSLSHSQNFVNISDVIDICQPSGCKLSCFPLPMQPIGEVSGMEAYSHGLLEKVVPSACYVSGPHGKPCL